MNKIIGFTISQKPINHDDFDVFNRNLRIISFVRNEYYHYFWGINEIEKCLQANQTSLSFGNHYDLLDKNVVITWSNEKITIQNDWLGSIPVFYNKNEKIVSTLSIKCLINKHINNEGLYNFIEAGYSILEQTPFEEVKFMRYYSKLSIQNRTFSIDYKPDPVDDTFFNESSKENDVINDIKEYIHSMEGISGQEILIPTSGGYDSRILNLFIQEKERIFAFTFGLTDQPDKCIEVVTAKKVSEILGTKWQQIPLSNQNLYMDEWFRIFGIGCHMHGMYQVEFYLNLLNKEHFSGDAVLASGIIGDAWSGKVSIPAITDYTLLNNLFYSHGIKANTNELLFLSDFALRKEFFRQNEDLLRDPRARIVFSMRFKLILLSYLYIIPEYFGFPVWTPFINFSIVKGQLNLPPERRKKRSWQEQLFERNNLNIEMLKLKSDAVNTMDYRAYLRHDFNPLDPKILSGFFNTRYIEMLNYPVIKKPGKLKRTCILFLNSCFRVKGLRRIIRKMGFSPSDVLFVHEFRIIKTLEKALCH